VREVVTGEHRGQEYGPSTVSPTRPRAGLTLGESKLWGEAAPCGEVAPGDPPPQSIDDGQREGGIEWPEAVAAEAIAADVPTEALAVAHPAWPAACSVHVWPGVCGQVVGHEVPGQEVTTDSEETDVAGEELRGGKLPTGGSRAHSCSMPRINSSWAASLQPGQSERGAVGRGGGGEGVGWASWEADERRMREGGR